MVSIIVPVYKVEQYLKRCVDSIRSQTYTDLEIILVDDGSPDSCGMICDDYAAMDPRVRVIHKKNGGVSSARNCGIEEVHGEYLTFCDSDDFYAPSWIEALVKAAEATDADMVRANLTFYHEDANLNSCTRRENGIFLLDDQEKRAQYCFSKIFGGNHGWEVCTRLFRVGIIKKNKICFCETCGNFAEDMGFVLEYTLCCNRVTSISEAGYMYYQRSNSMMASSEGKVKLDCVNEVSMYFAERSRKVLTPEYAQKVLPLFHFCILYNQYQAMMLACSPEDASRLIRKILRYSEWENQTKALFDCEEYLRLYFGKKQAHGILRITESCLSGNWESTIRKYRIYHKWNSRRIWLKEAMEKVLGGMICRT